MSVIQQMLMAVGRPPFTGQVSYTTPGTYSWVCPEGVYSVCVVAIGPGLPGVIETGAGGAGGGLGYKNNISVIPGQSYAVQVVGTRSYFISTTTVCGNAGNSSGGGTFVGDGGGNGGQGGGPANYTEGTITLRSGGGGGSAGAYTGAGGRGGGGSTTSTATPPAAGSQGSMGGMGGVISNVSPGQGGGGGGGGGSNLYGGVESPIAVVGTSGANGALYGGGGGGAYNATFSDGSTTYERGLAGGGAVRIIWGAGRAFPSTNVQDI